MMTSFALGGGREMPRLLFVTDEQALGAAVNAVAATSAFLKAVEATPNVSLLRVVTFGQKPNQVVDTVRAALKRIAPEGVVIVGSYDVVPSLRVDCIPSGSAVSRDDDEDAFVVWNDDAYGDPDDVGFPSIPVTRVPDGGSLRFVQRALSAAAPHPLGPHARVFGMRDKFRPFADAILASIAGKHDEMHVCGRAFDSVQSPWPRGVDLAYLMLHGSDVKPRRYHGHFEDNGPQMKAMSTRTIPPLHGATLFAGCCWGALIVDSKACTPAIEGQPLGGRTPKRSIALRALKNGANAFVGSTGLHYAPTGKVSTTSSGDPLDYFCKPLHASFWKHYAKHAAPALALLRAKREYLEGIPHDKGATDLKLALEAKTLREMTCLGLGW